VRDLRHIKSKRFPVFHGGIGPLDSRGRARMIEMDTAVDVAGVRVQTGDIVFGDIDGVVVIPQHSSVKIVERALGKIKSENHTRDALSRGVLLREVFAEFGVL
jgi:4-hydroxy-4-methyl-2-oxoglutarate aldolase